MMEYHALTFINRAHAQRGANSRKRGCTKYMQLSIKIRSAAGTIAPAMMPVCLAEPWRHAQGYNMGMGTNACTFLPPISRC